MSMHATLACHSMKRGLAIGVFAVIVCLGSAGHLSAQMAEQSQVEAAYLYNLAKFVEWPAKLFPDAENPVVICVIGDERLSNVLAQAVLGRKAQGRSVEARHPKSGTDFKLCHILFIGFDDKERIAEALSGTRGSGVLTVGQSSQFLALGGMINLALKNAKVELEIDPEASNAEGLKISSRLLVIARVAKFPRPEGGER
jgi:hypothetical protein